MQGGNSHYWTNNVLVGLDIKRSKRAFQLVLSPEFYFELFLSATTEYTDSVRPFGLPISMKPTDFFLWRRGKPFLQASLGMLRLKYNPDGRNFGDYIFRTGTYPTYIITNFDFPAARLLGLHLSSDPIANLHADLLLTSEAFIYPLFDFSLTGICELQTI